jgi:hypothetical protein
MGTAALKPVNWLARKRMAQEAGAFAEGRKLDIGIGRRRRHGDQVLKAFVQINVLPRPR